MAYAGDLPSKQAWDLLSTDKRAQLVDVRTVAEWMFVGTPDLSALDKKPILLSWQVYPTMQINPEFVGEVAKRAPSRDAPLLFLCRSGARSRSAAEAMTAAGYSRCYNIANGFEGPVDGKRHRGQAAGWKADRLPWTQD